MGFFQTIFLSEIQRFTDFFDSLKGTRKFPGAFFVAFY